MEMHQKRQCKSVSFFGVRPGVGTTTLAVNVAAILGVVARRKTLLLDLSGNGHGVSSHLGISGDRGLLNLTTPFLRDGRISAKDLAEQVVRYDPGEPWLTGISALDVLPGFDRARLSPAEEQRLCAYYGVALVRAVCESAHLAGYEFVLADNGVWLNEEMGFGMLRDSGQAILVSFPQEGDVLEIERLVKQMRDVDWHSLVVFNQARSWRFESTYRDLRFLERLNYALVPPAETDHLDKCRIRGMSPALLGLQSARRCPDKFVSAFIAVASHINLRLEDEMLDCHGQPVSTSRGILDLLVGPSARKSP
jgi:cellulose biosynthesis protein BcsQ